MVLHFVNGFRVIDIPLPRSGCFHSLFIKEHTERSSTNIKSITQTGPILFVGNIDYEFNMSNENIDIYLRFLFEQFGDVKSISISSLDESSTINHGYSRFAHLEYKKPSSLKNALNAANSLYFQVCKKMLENDGSANRELKSIAELKSSYLFVDENPDDLQEEVDEYMKDFEENENILKLELEKSLNEVDADGFIKVKNRSKRKRLHEPQTIKKNGVQKMKDTRKKRKNLELKNFYRFQIREDKIAKLDQLRKRFDADKEKVAKMKEARKFKPF
eukprot:gene11302-15162_t